LVVIFFPAGKIIQASLEAGRIHKRPGRAAMKSKQKGIPDFSTGNRKAAKEMD